MRIFLDANVLFSAARSAGAVSRFVEDLLESGHELCVDEYVVEEARRNLSAKAPGAEAVLTALLKRTRAVSARPSGVAVPELQLLPEKDRPVLAAAIHGNCEVLVTGDVTDFAQLLGKTVAGVTIHSPRSLYGAVFGR